MSSDNAKLGLVPEQDAGEALREMGYEPEHMEGTPTEQAKAMLEEAAGNLDEALHRMEEGTGNHDTVGTACDELDYVMYQTGAWQGDEAKQWLDGSDPVEHVVNCLTYCEEVAVCGDQDAPSTELVREAADSLNRAAILLWGDKFTTAFESRRNEADQRRAMAMLEDIAGERTTSDEDIEDEIAEAVLGVVADTAIDEAKCRAKSNAPTAIGEALDLLTDAATMATKMHVVADYMSESPEAPTWVNEMTEAMKEQAMDVMTGTLAAYYYLNGGTFADRDPEQGEADGDMLEYIYKQLENINDMLERSIKDGHVKREPDEDGAYQWQREAQSDLLCLMGDVHEAINGGTANAESATTVDASKVISRLEAIEDQLADAITDGDAWGDVDEDHPFYRVISAKNGILDLMRDIEAESDGDAR